MLKVYGNDNRSRRAMRVHLSLGTNLGDRARNLQDALHLLAQVPGVRLLLLSPVYETEPVGVRDQPAFYNLAVEIETDLPPLELLNAVKDLETRLGRETTYQWGPRLIDIDLVLWGNLVLSFEKLTLPHPEFRERAFVLAPLRDIAPDAVDPVTGMTVRQLASQPDVHGHVARLDACLLEPLRLEPQWDRDGFVTVQESH
jgi:2-amino-4-hydroxy-6-hydroxymethyldihydropteridine diphosphokinase